MATQAHCAYCIETLTTSLEKRPSLSLQQVETLWKQYHEDPDADLADQEPENTDTDENTPPVAPADPSYRPAAISRLLAPSPASSGSSSSVPSGSSTPSRASEGSSATSKSSKPVGDHPLFVTWNVLPKSGGEKRLRGCIGTFAPQELGEGLSSYALTSAFDDTRFQPISTRELPTLECGVTLLTDFEPIALPLDWVVGTHGLRISFSDRGRRYGSTYLPDVAHEQGWTKEETLVSLMRKAGWNGKKDQWSKVELSVVRYQGRQVRLAYQEWREWREWVDGEMAEG
ncbi:AMMECR1 domain-containing protein [Massariosphaeria phaeospora]|uniref:AMMECR1 domain-containing protein n=1 Tax=Massariosphaeria phaeospora TaxID=100035 RepID=A0A7C8I2A8_9PLEO|nr:AMMECR1 domain-containing protein [Massariosphaeria phaeospora]